MAKNSLNDWSTDQSQNTDLGGTPVLGSAKPSVMITWIRKMMAQVADWVTGAVPLYDTVTYRDPDDAAKTFRFDAGNLSAAAVIDMDRVDRTATIADISGGIYGLTISNSPDDATNDIIVGIGRATDSTGTDVLVLETAITKKLDASWVVGTAQGGRDTGSISNGTWYVFVIKRPDTGVVDVLLSTSPTSPTLPSNYTLFRRIGSVIRSGAAILPFVQDGDKFLYRTPVLDVDVTNQDNSNTLRALTVPIGINVFAEIHVRMVAATPWQAVVSSPLTSNPSPGNFSTHGGSGTIPDRRQMSIRTDTSGQVRTRSTVSDTTVQIWTWGWIDTRDR